MEIKPGVIRKLVEEYEAKYFCGMGEVRVMDKENPRPIRSGFVGPCVVKTFKLSDGRYGMVHLNRQDFNEGWWVESVAEKLGKMGITERVSWVQEENNDEYFANKSGVEFTLSPSGILKKKNFSYNSIQPKEIDRDKIFNHVDNPIKGF